MAASAALVFEVVLAWDPCCRSADRYLRVLVVAAADPAPVGRNRGDIRLFDRDCAHCWPPSSRLAPAGPHRLATVDEPRSGSLGAVAITLTPSMHSWRSCAFSLQGAWRR